MLILDKYLFVVYLIGMEICAEHESLDNKDECEEKWED